MANHNLETVYIHTSTTPVTLPSPESLVECDTCHTQVQAGDATYYHIVEPIEGNDHLLRDTGEIEFECHPCLAKYFASLETSE